MTRLTDEQLAELEKCVRDKEWFFQGDGTIVITLAIKAGEQVGGEVDYTLAEFANPIDCMAAVRAVNNLPALLAEIIEKRENEREEAIYD